VCFPLLAVLDPNVTGLLVVRSACCTYVAITTTSLQRNYIRTSESYTSVLDSLLLIYCLLLISITYTATVAATKVSLWSDIR
jgi:hypothetical protein